MGSVAWQAFRGPVMINDCRLRQKNSLNDQTISILGLYFFLFEVVLLEPLVAFPYPFGSGHEPVYVSLR